MKRNVCLLIAVIHFFYNNIYAFRTPDAVYVQYYMDEILSLKNIAFLNGFL